jgi:hypothetical protein
MNEQPNNYYQQKQPVPNSTGALVLGIISIATCIAYGVVGLVCGIIGLVLANKAITMYHTNPSEYTQTSFNNAKAGKVCSIIGICLSALFLLLLALGIFAAYTSINTTDMR